MRRLEAGRYLMAAILRRAAEEFCAAKKMSEPEWLDRLRCDWGSVSVRGRKEGGAWLADIDGRHLFWTHPVDVSDPAAASSLSAMLCTHYGCEQVAERLLARISRP